ncbi:MAG: ATPase domain-containing protein [Thermoproteus sp.]
MLGLRGVTLVYGPPGAGKTTFAAWYTYSNYERIFWVSVFEDEVSFRRNMAALGYDFGGRLTFWEAPLIDAEAFFGTLLDAVARERPQALVVDSVTEALAAGGGVGAIHNILYRAVKQGGVDVFITAEEEAASKVTYIADNVIKLDYEVYPYGAVREAVVKKVRGGRAGFSLPFVIREGRGMVFLAPVASTRAAVERLETGTCLDEVVGGLYKGLLHAIVGPVGAGKTWLMLKAARSLKERGRKALYIAVSGAGAVYADRFGVGSVDVGLNVEEMLAAVSSWDGEVVFVRGLEALAAMYGSSVLYMALRILLQTARGGKAVVVSLRDLHDLDILFDVIVRVEEKSAVGMRGPGGRIGEKITC